LYNNQGLARYNRRQYERALADCNGAIRLEPNDPIFLMNRGLCHQGMRYHDAAAADFEAALRHDPSHAADHRQRIDEVKAARTAGKNGR
jgi:tetratricopeptide (TPR) repeat protein